VVSLSVLFERGVGDDEAAGALAKAGLVEGLSWEPVEQEGMTGKLGWVAVDGHDVGVLLVESPIGRDLLRDAVQHSPWQLAGDAVKRHVAHARVFCPGDDGALERLGAASRVAGALLGLLGALGLVDDASGALNEAAHALKRIADGRALPLDLWIRVRYFGMADAAGYFMDTVGMEQLGLPDLEAYAGPGLRTTVVADWLRNLSLYLVQQGAPIRSGNTLDGPDEQPWIAKEDGSTVEPARKVVRFRALPPEEPPAETG
jgi:hypothetical protein